MKIRNGRKMILYVLMIALLLTSIAYALLQTTLSITGSVTKKGGDWNIYFDNVSNPVITGDAVMAKPSLKNSTDLSFTSSLSKPSDKAEFTVDVINGGTFDAVLNTLLITGIEAAEAHDITYRVTYVDGTEIKENDTLKQGQTRTLKISVSYNSTSDISSNNVTLELGVVMLYIQGDGDVEVPGGNTDVTNPSSVSVPNLMDSSLTPVMYVEEANNGEGSWVIAATNMQWYDYSQQKWANAVILNSGVSNTPGTPIDVETQAKAMYVWIPRYEYQIEGQYGTHTDGTAGTQELPGEIKVNFISKEKTTASNGYIIHPAFQWDSNGDGNISANEQISGIWVGKFETSGTAEAPTILPNKKALVNQDLIVLLSAPRVLGMSLSEHSTDTHLMKNSEWGAVAYLSQSQYGKYGNSNYSSDNKEIYTNNSRDMYTGRSAGAPAGFTTSSSNEGTCHYDDITPKEDGTGSCGGGASTTGNIYGVYDMVGGAHDLVAAGIKSELEANEIFNGGVSPKYFDLYTSNDILTACNGGICYGHALSETGGWYSDLNGRLSLTLHLIDRGSNFGQDGGPTSPGIFAFGIESISNSNASFHITLLAPGA